MQYAILLYADASFDASPEGPEWQAAIPHHMVFNQELQDRGLEYTGGALTGANMATTLRTVNGERLITDGPFAETKEQLWGYYVVEAPDIDTILEVSAKLWEAENGSVEIRPLLNVPTPEGAPGTGVAGA